MNTYVVILKRLTRTLWSHTSTVCLTSELGEARRLFLDLQVGDPTQTEHKVVCRRGRTKQKFEGQIEVSDVGEGVGSAGAFTTRKLSALLSWKF